MKTFLKNLAMTVAGLVMIPVIATSVVNAETVKPYFNWYNNVPEVGDESNFVRINDMQGGDTSEACTNGDKVNVWMYLHNGSEAAFNGDNRDGEGVAVGTTLKVNADLNTNSKSHTITGVISANNADSVSDTVTITCGDHEVKLKYNGVVSFKTTNTEGGYGINGDPINGAYIGFTDGDRQGVVPGCWDYRASVVVQFEVVEEPQENDFSLECRVLNLEAIVDKKNAYKISVDTSVNPDEAARVKTAKINITGPNSYAAQFDGLSVDDYTFPSVDGRYTIKATVEFEVAEGYNSQTATIVTCERHVDIESKQPPKQPPVEHLPRTGAGTNIALIAIAVVAAGTFAYRKYIVSRQS
ncbi:hypothetical protein KC878_03945 [Candidatus Saccharibacteria bacterium]|nr:hypothetical protein [Candidatus Saccharibacteria bacterium]MCB9820914.1 hypothetical protein [Candidatus Nomurabacteria bacterium]